MKVAIIGAGLSGLYEYRKMLNSLSNEDYDRLLSFIGFLVIKQFLYNNKIYKAKHGLLFPKLVCRMKNKMNK